MKKVFPIKRGNGQKYINLDVLRAINEEQYGILVPYIPHSLVGRAAISIVGTYHNPRGCVAEVVAGISSIVVEGLLGGETAQDMIMWANLGYPPCSHVVPVTLDEIPAEAGPASYKGFYSPMGVEASERMKNRRRLSSCPLQELRPPCGGGSMNFLPMTLWRLATVGLSIRTMCRAIRRRPP